MALRLSKSDSGLNPTQHQFRAKATPEVHCKGQACVRFVFASCSSTHLACGGRQQGQQASAPAPGGQQGAASFQDGALPLVPLPPAAPPFLQSEQNTGTRGTAGTRVKSYAHYIQAALYDVSNANTVHSTTRQLMATRRFIMPKGLVSNHCSLCGVHPELDSRMWQGGTLQCSYQNTTHYV